MAVQSFLPIVGHTSCRLLINDFGGLTGGTKLPNVGSMQKVHSSKGRMFAAMLKLISVFCTDTTLLSLSNNCSPGAKRR